MRSLMLISAPCSRGLDSVIIWPQRQSKVNVLQSERLSAALVDSMSLCPPPSPCSWPSSSSSCSRPATLVDEYARIREQHRENRSAHVDTIGALTSLCCCASLLKIYCHFAISFLDVLSVQLHPSPLLFNI